MSPKIIALISNALGIQESSVRNTIALLSEGATVPFISRYRKERTGSLDEVQIANIQKAYKKQLDLVARKETIIKAIEEQNALTEKLRKKIMETYDPTELEDIYLPYKRKRKTKAGHARSNGLEPLAVLIKNQRTHNIRAEAKKYLNKNITSANAAIEGAQHIISEWISEDDKVREKTRSSLRKHGSLVSKVVKTKKTDASKYKDYFDFEERLDRCPSHRFLAIQRGKAEGLLRSGLSIDHERIIHTIERKYVSPSGPCADLLRQAIQDGYKRLVLPSVENQVLAEYKEKADLVAIEVFIKNLRQLLLTAPLGQKSILAIDPGFRTGCKVVVLDRNGNLKANATIYPHPPQNKTTEAVELIQRLTKKHKVDAIAIGNGTAGRETEAFIKGSGITIDSYMVNEDGASIYSASEIAREEFPSHDVTVRGSISIGRRLMDPLAELVKIDPKSIGVGQYQHDVNQSLLKESLDHTIMSCVNSVGINLNTASKHLLTYVSGLGPVTADNIVQYRKENGAFSSRSQLKKVPRIGAKAFEQAAGFLRIRPAKNALDNTGVHPEAYATVQKMAKDTGCAIQDLIDQPQKIKSLDLQRYVTSDIGLPTLKDIIKELEKPGLDPRGTVSKFSFDGRVRSIEDLKEGMILPGLVTNITNFGAFIDIGIKQGGLVHISQIADKFVSNPADVLSLNQQVTVKVLDIDTQRGRVSLTMKNL